MTGLLIAGTSSDAGKSLITAGLCRILARRGVSVAPFKSQNMSNNSAVCPDGSEISRAQYLQAIAARVEPESAMNPVLLKPGTDRRSHIVLRGEPAGTLEAGEYATGRDRLREAAFAAHAELAGRFDIVLCEGAGSPAEINLRGGDYVNFGLARRFDLPVVLCGDIDRGGVLAAVYGTWAIVDPDDRALLAGYLINKFRGDESVLAPGLTELTARTGLTNFGVVPWLPNVWLDGEDALAFARWPRTPGRTGTLRIAVVRLPRISNATDMDALAAEPGVDVLVTASPADVADADLVILPGTRSPVDDLDWLRAQGLADAIRSRVAANGPVLGIGEGFAMLTGEVQCGTQDAPAPEAATPGVGAVPVTVRPGPTRTSRHSTGTWRGHPVAAYEVTHRTVDADRGEDFPGGVRIGNTCGTTWHGLFDNDGFRRAWLSQLAETVGSPWTPDPDAPGFAERRELMLDSLADSLTEHVDVDALLGLAR